MEGIKYAQTSFTSQFTKLKNIRGERVPYDNQADVVSEYLWEMPETANEHLVHDKVHPSKVVNAHLGTGVGKPTCVDSTRLSTHTKTMPPRATTCITELFKILSEENNYVSYIYCTCAGKTKIAQGY